MEEGTVFRVEGNPELSVSWSDPTSLSIRYRRRNPADRIYRQEPAWESVRVDVLVDDEH